MKGENTRVFNKRGAGRDLRLGFCRLFLAVAQCGRLLTFGSGGVEVLSLYRVIR